MARHRKSLNDDHEFDADADWPDTPRLSPSVQAQLGQRLRAFYEALALGERPIPDRFIEIIDRLDQGAHEFRQEKHS
jgi:hypothetical protein